ncbi:MAG: hypothetical protein LBL39_02580 [Planctomycetaceae bacterium]|nr:hypothetical protein [Planctomycetaceae bacterium]
MFVWFADRRLRSAPPPVIHNNTASAVKRKFITITLIIHERLRICSP